MSKYRRAKTAVDRSYISHPGEHNSAYYPRSLSRNAMATQTDVDVNFLPNLPREKSTMTEYEQVPPVYASYDERYMEQEPEAEREPDHKNINYNDFYRRISKNLATQRPRYMALRQSMPAAAPMRSYAEPKRPSAPATFRSGRVGAPWRHVAQCTGNLGNHICFIDGVIKQDDMDSYPPWGYVQQPSPDDFAHMAQQLRADPPKKQPRTYSNAFHKHAKQGFEYWKDDRVPMSSRYNKYRVNPALTLR